MRLRRWVCVLLVCLVGCGGGDAERVPTFSVDTLATGTVIVENDREGFWTDTQRWHLEEDLRLGTIEGELPESFSQVAWITEDVDGNIFILDYPAQDIRVFSPDGEHLRTISRPGEGPGELTRAAGINWATDDRFWVWGSTRYSVFARDGTFDTSYRRLVRGVIYPWGGGFDGDDFFDWGLDFERGADPNELTGRSTMYPIRFSPPETYDTLPPIEWQMFNTPGGTRALGRQRSVALKMTGDGHVWFAMTDEYRLFKRSLAGDTVRIATLPAEAETIPDAEIDSVIRMGRERGDPRDLEVDDFVRERRLVTRIVLGPGGLVYVFPHEAGAPEGTVVDVFEDDGVYLGRMEFGETVLTLGPPPYATRDHIYAVVNDDFDVPYVVRWRIVRPVQ
ncbi:MAG: 6-bladed beta-propeller [Gemmatimonadota bacterium]